MKSSLIYSATLALISLCSCNGILGDIYDEAPDDNALEAGFTAVGNTGRRYNLYIDATSYTQWHFIDLDNLKITTKDIPTSLTGNWDNVSGITLQEVNGNVFTQLALTKTDPQPEAEQWQFALHHFDARTNGCTVAETNYTSIDQLPAPSALQNLTFSADAWSNSDVIVDLTGMMAFRVGYQNISVNQVLSRWINMDFSTPPPTYTASGKVYVMKLPNGKMAALQLLNYMSPAGSKGFLTIDILYPYE